MDIQRAVGLLALVIFACAIFVSQASAVTPEADYEKLPATAIGESGVSALSTASGGTVSCTSGTGSGESTSSTTGTGSYILHGCFEKITGFNFSCNSEGQSGGTIKLPTVTGHLVYLDEAHTIPGVLATPPANGVFIKFTCTPLITIEVKGNGVLGRISAPKCGETSTKGTVLTEITSHGVPKYKQVEETGTVYGLTASTNGGAPVAAATTWSVTGTSNQPVTLTCPEQK
jgi:hypothetical protein